MAEIAYERIREHGTREIMTDNPAARIAAFRRVVAEKQYAKIDGTMIDLFSASIVVQVYDALNDANKAKLAAMSAGKMALIAMEVAATGSK